MTELESLLVAEMSREYGSHHKTLGSLVQAALLHADELAQTHQHDGWSSQSSQPHAYASEAQTCARQIAYRLLLPGEDEPDYASRCNFAFGNLAHGFLQAALATLHRDFKPEVRWDEGDISGRADGLYTHNGHRYCVEIKTISQKGFTRVGKDGPRSEHVLQATLSAIREGCSYIHIIYLSKGKKSGLLEFIQPTNPAPAIQEKSRLRLIVKRAVSGQLPAREWQGVLIRHPEDQTFPCSWCPFRDRCVLRSSVEEPFDGLVAACSSPS